MLVFDIPALLNCARLIVIELMPFYRQISQIETNLSTDS